MWASSSGIISPASPGAATLDPDLLGRIQEDAEEAARTKLDEQAQRVRESGGEVAEVHTRGLAGPMRRSWDWLMSSESG